MKKIAILILSILIAGLFVACNQDITVDAQTYANMEVGTFVLNGQNYATLQAAVDAIGSKAAGDNVIKLTRNASGPGAKIASKDVTIDFQGFTYSFTNVNGLQGQDVTGKDFGLSITTGSDVVLKGLQKIDLNDKTTTDLTMVYVEGATTSLTIEDAPKMEVANSQYVFWAANGATLTVGSNSTTAPTTISGKIAATGGTASKPVVTFNNNTKIEASELKADSAVVVINTSEASTIDSFVGANEANIVVSGTGDVTVTKNDSGDGTYEIENTSSSSETKVEVPTKDGSTTREITPGEKVEGDAAPEEDTTPSVARIGAKLYGTLSEAVGVANSSDSKLTIVILKDIEIAGSISITNSMVIDGSSHKITTEGTATSGNMAAFDICEANSTVAPITVDIQDISVVSTKHARVFLINGDYCTYENPNVLNAKNVKITTDGEAFYANGPTVIYARECKLTHDGVYLSGKDPVYYSAIIVGYNGTINIYDSEITSFGNGAATFPSGGTVNIYNTDITSLDDTVASLTGYLFWARHEKSYDTGAYKDYCSSAIINVFSGSNSGKFKITDDGHTSANRVSEINVYDGVFNDVSFVVDGAGASNDSIVITGGIYSSDPSAYVADGYVARKTGDVWIVEKADTEEVEADGTKMSLVDFAKSVNAGEDYANKTVKLLKDVNLAGIEWIPIGTSIHPFSGKFDGQGKTIFGLSIISDSDYNGLFGFVKSDTPNESFTGVESLVTGYDIDTTNVSESKYTAVVKNVKISDVSINVTGKKYTGAIAGYALNSYVGNCEVLSGKITGYKCTGGIVGTADQSSINNCKVHSDTLIEIKKDSSGTNAGGIVGTIQYLASGYPIFIGNCTFEGTVDCSKIASDQACGGIGGIIAYASALQDKGVVYKCINRGTLKANKAGMVGGICGYGNSMGLFADCENDGKFEITGEVTSDVYGVGGIVGVRNNQAVSFFRCVNDSDITVNSKYLGGLCGYADNGVEVMNCANNGNLVSTSSDPDVRLLVSGPSGADYNGYVIYNKSYEKANEIIEGLSESGMEFIELRSISEGGTISVPSWVKHIETDDNYNFTISSNIAANHLRLIGSGTYTIAEGSSVNNLVLSGTSFTLTNNGTINGYVEIGGGVTATINNEASRKIGGVGSVASTPSNVTINNHGLISRNSGDQGNQHTISFSNGHHVVVNNYGTGTIENNGNSYVLLSYINSVIEYNAYDGSMLNKTGSSSFIIIDNNGGSIAVHYAPESKYCINSSEHSWTDYYPWGNITVTPMDN